MEERTLLDQVDELAGSREMSRVFTAHVFSWMVAGLAVTAAVAWYFASSQAMWDLLFTAEGGRTMLGWVVALAPLGFIFGMNLAFNRLSAVGITLLFLLFSATMGASLSYIFLAFSLGSITKVFVITSATFAIMAVVGYTTKTDLTKFGSLLFMGLIGIIIAMVVNWFLGSAMLDYLISVIGVLIFTGLIAYDTQKIRRIGAVVGLDNMEGRKMAIIAATSLYLDFINLFLFLLRLLGSRD